MAGNQNAIAYGILKQAGVDTEGMTPKEAWEKVKELGLGSVYGKKNKSQNRSSNASYNQTDEPFAPNSRFEADPSHIAGVHPGEPMSFKKANNKNANPKFRDSIKSPYFHNCQVCVLAFEARLRGYDVCAKAFDADNSQMLLLANSPERVYIDPDGKPPAYISTPKGVNRLTALKNQIQEGKRYNLIIKYTDESGHIITTFKKNGKIIFYDPQSGENMDEKQFEKKYMSLSPKRFDMFRVDNCTINGKIANKVLKGSRK